MDTDTGSDNETGTKCLETKPWWTSRTIWANIVTVVVAMLAAPEIQDAVGPEGLKWIAAGQAALNIVLRLTTSTAIGPRDTRGGSGA